MSMEDDKTAVAKALRHLANHVDMASFVLVKSFDVKAEVERDCFMELVQNDGYQKFAPTGDRRVLLDISYCLPPDRTNDNPPPMGADW